jgi:hypothetical protein
MPDLIPEEHGIFDRNPAMPYDIDNIFDSLINSGKDSAPF